MRRNELLPTLLRTLLPVFCSLPFALFIFPIKRDAHQTALTYTQTPDPKPYSFIRADQSRQSRPTNSKSTVKLELDSSRGEETKRQKDAISTITPAPYVFKQHCTFRPMLPYPPPSRLDNRTPNITPTSHFTSGSS